MNKRLAACLAVLLAACTLPPTLQPRARILVLPSELSRALQIQLDNVIYQGNAPQPGKVNGQVVRVASVDGATLTCEFRAGEWKRGSPGLCRDGAGRQYEMLVGENPMR